MNEFGQNEGGLRPAVPPRFMPKCENTSLFRRHKLYCFDVNLFYSIITVQNLTFQKQYDDVHALFRIIFSCCNMVSQKCFDNPVTTHM